MAAAGSGMIDPAKSAKYPVRLGKGLQESLQGKATSRHRLLSSVKCEILTVNGLSTVNAALYLTSPYN